MKRPLLWWWWFGNFLILLSALRPLNLLSFSLGYVCSLMMNDIMLWSFSLFYWCFCLSILVQYLHRVLINFVWNSRSPLTACISEKVLCCLFLAFGPCPLRWSWLFCNWSWKRAFYFRLLWYESIFRALIWQSFSSNGSKNSLWYQWCIQLWRHIRPSGLFALPMICTFWFSHSVQVTNFSLCHPYLAARRLPLRWAFKLQWAWLCP